MHVLLAVRWQPLSRLSSRWVSVEFPPQKLGDHVTVCVLIVLLLCSPSVLFFQVFQISVLQNRFTSSSLHHRRWELVWKTRADPTDTRSDTRRPPFAVLLRNNFHSHTGRRRLHQQWVSQHLNYEYLCEPESEWFHHCFLILSRKHSDSTSD